MEDQAPTRIGPYRIVEALGRGGMGVVYRAEHVRSGQRVALKTVIVRRAGLLQSIRREVRALARIRHPGVVRILEEGLWKGMPWYAMELLVGKTLRKACAELQTDAATTAPAETERMETRRLTLETETPGGTAEFGFGIGAKLDATDAASGAQQPAAGLRRKAAGGALLPVLRLLRRLCAPLGFLHGEGIVHRDLKPENVIVRPDGRPVILDFGLIAQFPGEVGREELELGGMQGGTVAYMAPEQGRGELVDARADLYALGCILYELLTGQPPFLGSSPAQILHQHLNAAPSAPSKLVDGVPPELDALVLRLLAKSPRERLGHADALAALLSNLGALDGTPEGPAPRAYLYRPGFAGRDEVLAKLDPLLVELESEAGGLVVLSGASGIGKTRLAMELGRRAQARRLQVLGGECIAPDAAPLAPLQRILQAVADRCREQGCAETDRLLGRRGRLLAIYEPSLRELPGQETYPKPTELPGAVGRLRLFNYLAETLAAFAVEQPVLLILDDLHWADELTLGLLEFLARTGRLRQVPLLIVGTCRTEELSEPLQRVLRAPGVRRMEISRLDKPAVQAMIQEMLALPEAPEALVGFLARQCKGNPFFVAEYLRTAVSEGLLFRDEAGRWQVLGGKEPLAAVQYHRLPLPHSLRELVTRHLGLLPEPALRMVEICSVLGREVDESVLVEAGRGRVEDAVDAIGLLLAAQVLEPASAGRLRFVHGEVRDVAYTQIAEADRRGLHRDAAQAMQSKRSVSLAALGQHWEEAGEPAKARACYHQAAVRAMERFAHREAGQLYHAYLRLAEARGPQTTEARHQLAESLRFQGQATEAIAEHETALAEARELGAPEAQVRSLGTLALNYCEIGHLDKAQAFFEQALSMSREIGDRPAEATLLNGLGVLVYQQGQVGQAGELYAQALAVSRKLGDQAGEGRALLNLGVCAAQQGEASVARGLYEETLRLDRALGHRRYEATALGNLANLHADQGEQAEALAMFARALGVAREIGDIRTEGQILGNSAAFQSVLGRPEEARALLEQALALQRQAGDPQSEAAALSNLANVLAKQGELLEALGLLEQSIAIFRQLGNRRGTSVALVSRASVERRTGQLEEARGSLEEAQTLLQELGDRLNLALAYCEHGHVELAGGGAAAGFLREAERLQAQLGAGPESELAQATEALRRAVAAALD